MSTSIPVAVVTGASGALGHVTVQHLLQQGFSVAALGRAPEALQSIFCDDDTRLMAIAADVTDYNSLQNATRLVLAQWGWIDALVNIAGGFSMGSSLEPEAVGTWEHLIQLNAGSVFKAVHCMAPGMLQRGQGSIINIGAQSALNGQPGMAAYCASKSAVSRMTESFAAEFKGKGVRVNCLLPRIIDTPQNRKAMPHADFTEWTPAEQIAQVIGFLVSNQSVAVTGASIAV